MRLSRDLPNLPHTHGHPLQPVVWGEFELPQEGSSSLIKRTASWPLLVKSEEAFS